MTQASKFIRIGKSLVFWLAATVFFTSSAYGKCSSKSETIFSCTTAKSKLIEVCEAGKSITYTFGSPNQKPDINLVVPRGKVTKTPWNGIGRVMSDSVEIPHGNTTYSVFYSVDKQLDGNNPATKPVSGVQVLVNDAHKSVVRCSGKKVINNLQNVDLKTSR